MPLYSRFVICLVAVLIPHTAAAAAITVYSSDFEANSGGWTSSGFPSWEWGSIAFTDADCDDAGTTGPTGSNSGTRAWGTVLNTCYANSDQTSSLSQTFDLTGSTSATFSWYDWREVFFPFDSGQFFANGDLLYSIPDANKVDWTQHTVDLTPYVGDLVTLRFDLFATTVVNRPGWYLDDMELTATAAVPEPAIIVLLGIAGGLLTRRRFAR